jgi:hypothetical protein
MVPETPESKTPMDENTIRIFQELLEKFVETKERFGSNSKAMDEFEQMLKKTFGSLGGFYKQVNKNSEHFSQSLTALSKAVRRGEASYADQHRLLKQLNNAIEDAKEANADAAEIQKLIDQKKLLAERANQQRQKEQLQESGKSFGEAIRAGSAQMATGAGQFVRGLQAGQSGVQITTGLMNAALDVASASAGGLSKGLTNAGAAIFAFPNIWTKVIGGLTMGTGAVVGMFQGAAAQLAKFGFEIASMEVEKTVKAFHALSSSGALFARGMDDIRVYSGRAGLTLTEFSDVIKGNSQNLAAAGFGVSEGAKIVGNVTSQFPKTVGKSGLSLQREMQNLGFSFKEQADLSTEVIADLRRTGRTATNQQVAEATAELAKNMRIVAEITGEDAKQKMDQAKKNSEEYAFNQKVQEMARRTGNTALPQTMQAFLSTLDDASQRYFMQAVVLDGAVTDTAAHITGLAEPSQQAARAFLTGSTSIEDFMGPFARFGDKQLTTLNQTGEAISRGYIALGVNADLAQAQNAAYRQAQRVNSESMARTIKNVKDSVAASGGMHEDVMTAEKKAHDMAVRLERDMGPAIKKFADVSLSMLELVENKLAELGLLKKAPETRQQQTFEQVKDQLEKSREQDNRTLIAKLKDTGKSAETVALEKKFQQLEAQQRDYTVAKDLYDTGLKDMIDRRRQEETQKKYGAEAGDHNTVELTAQQRQEVENLFKEEFKKRYGDKRVAAASGVRFSGGRTAVDILAAGAAPAVPAAGAAPAAGAVPAGTGKNALSDMGLRTKAGDVQAEGAYISPKLIELARQIQTSVPGFNYFSGANDQFHQLHKPTSAHTQGLALDFTLGQRPSAEQGQQIIAQLKSLGASYVADEYNYPSKSTTAGHIHVEVPAMARGGITSGLTLAGEAGPEAVVPLPDGKSIPVQQINNKEMVDLMQRQLTAMQEQTELTRRMINEQQRGNRVSRDILTASY